MPLLHDFVLASEDTDMDLSTYLELNEIMTHEVNNFLLDLAGIDRQLTADGPSNYRTFLNRLDEESISVIDFFARPTERHGRCEDVIKVLANSFYSNPNHYATVEFLVLMVKSRLNILKNTVGFISINVLETLAPRLGAQLEATQNGQACTDDLAHLNRVLGQLVEALIVFVDNATLAGVKFLVPRLTRVVTKNHFLLGIEAMLPGLYAKLLQTKHTKTTCRLLSHLTKLFIDDQLEEEWQVVLSDFLADFLADELEQFLWSPSNDVVKCAFNLLLEVQREYGVESVMNETSTVRTYRKLLDADFEVQTLAFTFMQTTTATTGSILTKFVKFLLAIDMTSADDIAKAYNSVWDFEELRNLTQMQQILASNALSGPETLVFIRMVVCVFAKSCEADREQREAGLESANADLARFISGFPALLWEMEGEELIFTELFKVMDTCDAQWFERPSEEGGVNIIDQILTIIADGTGKTHYQLFTTYRMLHKIGAKSRALADRITLFLREVLENFVQVFRFDETCQPDKTLGSTIVYSNIRFILIHMSAIYEWFPLHSLIPDGVLETFHQVVAADLTLGRLATSDTVEKGCLISMVTRLYYQVYANSVRAGNVKATKTCVKNLISFARWLHMEFFGLADCDAFLAMQVQAATCDILLIFSTAATARLPSNIPKLCEKVGKVLDAEFIDTLVAFVAQTVFNETSPEDHGFKLRMLSQWNAFQRVYSDFQDFCAAAKILEHLADAGLYQPKIEELVKYLMLRDQRLAYKVMAFTVSGLQAVDRCQAFSQELVQVLGKLHSGDAKIVSHTVSMILKYVLNDLEMTNPETNEPIEHPFAILNGLGPLAEALNRHDSKYVLEKLRSSIGGGEAQPGNVPMPLQLMSPDFVAFEDLLKKK